MKTQRCRLQNLMAISGILCVILMFSVLAFGQDQPFQSNRPAPGVQAGPQGARGPMMAERPGMMGPSRAFAGPDGPGGRAGRGGVDGPGGPRMGQSDPLAELLRPEVQKELAITAEQRQKLEDLRFNHEKESIQHRAAMQIQRMELSRLMKADNPDRAAIDKKVQELTQEEAAQMRSSINANLNSRAVLTAEQRAKLAQFRESRMSPERPQAQGGMRPNRPMAKQGPTGSGVPTPPSPPTPPSK